MIYLYLVRHGETLANQQGVYYGRSDAPLVKQGVEQAERLATALTDIPFDRVLVSSRLRSQQTAARILNRHKAIEPEIMHEFDELDFGDWEGCHYQQLMAQDRTRYQRWCDSWKTELTPNGESFEQLKHRVTAGLRLILSQAKHRQKDRHWLLVGHQGSLRCLLLVALNLPDDAFWQFSFHQGAYSVISLDHNHGLVQHLNI